MTTAAEQYRKLVAKLEAINPSEPVNEAGEMEPAQSAMNVASGNIPQASSVPQAGQTPAVASNEIPTLTGTFKQAYAQAVKQGLKQFQWCGTYSTRRGQGPKPAASGPYLGAGNSPGNVTLGGSIQGPATTGQWNGQDVDVPAGTQGE